jgi:hypothetical protein
MSVNAISHVANIWSRATSALSSAPTSQGVDAPKPNEAGGPKPKAGPNGAAQAATPFQTLSSDLQSALIQLQAQKNAKG